MYAAGKTIYEIAEALVIGKSTVGRAIRQYDIGRGHKGRPNPKNAAYRRKSVMVDGKKLCTKCGIFKLPQQFPNSILSLDGLRPTCHTCYEAQVRARKATQGRATPVWADRTAIEAIYREAKMQSREEGVPYEVDHIYPLCGRTVSGLHVADNLQIVTRTENRSKYNKHKE